MILEGMKLAQLKEYFPFLVPLIILEFALLFITIRHILTHSTYKRGNRTIWMIIAIVGMNMIGPILYFTLGKEDE